MSTETQAQAIFDHLAIERAGERIAELEVANAKLSAQVQSLLAQQKRVRDAKARADREAREAKAAADRAHVDRFRSPGGQPCPMDGTVISAVHPDADSDHLAPGWHTGPGGTWICDNCWSDRFFAGHAMTEAEIRGGIAIDVLRAYGLAGLHIAPDLGEKITGPGRHIPLYWHEHDPRPPTRDRPGSTVERFSFVDPHAILEAAKPRLPQPVVVSGPPCPTCQGDSWESLPGGEVSVPGLPHPVYAGPALQCVACGHIVDVPAPPPPAPPAWLHDADLLAGMGYAGVRTGD